MREWGRSLAGTLGAPEWVGQVALMLVGAIGVFLIMALAALAFVWLERKVAGRIQSRYGPNRAGKFGLLQTLADAGRAEQEHHQATEAEGQAPGVKEHGFCRP